MSRVGCLALLLCLLVAPAGAQETKSAQRGEKTVAGNNVLGRLAGSWTLKSSVWGLGFASSTSPGDKTPPTVITRRGKSVTVNARLQTGQGAYGVPEFNEFTFTLTQAEGEAAGYLLSVESASWLTLNQLPMAMASTGELKGETTLPFRGAPLPLEVVIQFAADGGHRWDLTQKQASGKLLRSFTLEFTRPATAVP